jgi:hypothetical protein
MIERPAYGGSERRRGIDPDRVKEWHASEHAEPAEQESP